MKGIRKIINMWKNTNSNFYSENYKRLDRLFKLLTEEPKSKEGIYFMIFLGCCLLLLMLYYLLKWSCGW